MNLKTGIPCCRKVAFVDRAVFRVMFEVSGTSSHKPTERCCESTKNELPRGELRGIRPKKR